jgi:aminoglycoside phosphotransferase family enzyme/predicted kinase
MNDNGNMQERVLALLSDPSTHGGHPVRRIDTHAASVFLAGERALKVKRAVRFPFLDYSTLEKRKRACEAEIEVNRPFAPTIYRGVTAITQAQDGGLALGGNGVPVEWAVEMRRFDEAQTLDHLAAAHRIDAALADALGRAVADAHRSMRPIDGGAWIAAVGSYIDEHRDAFLAAPDVLAADAVKDFEAAQRAAYRRILPLLRERSRLGFIRRIHGDLHLGNIVLIDGKPVAFDAIEFSDIIAAGDLLYDLAFLLMDLIARDLRGVPDIVLNRYLTEAHDPSHLDALAALPFLLSMRAAIRAKVVLARYHQVETEARKPLAGETRAYFALAQRLIAPPPPRLVAIGGLSGTGKSALARALAPALLPEPGAVVVRSDVERKALYGVSETEKLPPEAYAREVTKRVYAVLTARAARIVRAGHSAIVDAVFSHPDERATIVAAAQAAGVAFRGLFLTAPLSVRTARIGTRAADASDADAAVAAAQETYELGPLEWPTVDASGTLDETLRRARAMLNAD